MTIPPTDGSDADSKVEVDDYWLTDLDMIPTIEAESDAEIMAALDASDDYTPSDPISVTPVADWLTDVQELARKHGPFAPWQIVQIIRELNAVDDPAVEASR